MAGCPDSSDPVRPSPCRLRHRRGPLRVRAFGQLRLAAHGIAITIRFHLPMVQLPELRVPLRTGELIITRISCPPAASGSEAFESDSMVTQATRSVHQTNIYNNEKRREQSNECHDVVQRKESLTSAAGLFGLTRRPNRKQHATLINRTVCVVGELNCLTSKRIASVFESEQRSYLPNRLKA